MPFPGRNSQTKWFPAGKKSCGNLSLNDSGENTHKKTDVTGYTWEPPFQCGTNMRHKMHVHLINVHKKDYTEELAYDLAYYNTVTNGKKILIPLTYLCSEQTSEDSPKPRSGRITLTKQPLTTTGFPDLSKICLVRIRSLTYHLS